MWKIHKNIRYSCEIFLYSMPKTLILLKELYVILTPKGNGRFCTVYAFKNIICSMPNSVPVDSKILIKLSLILQNNTEDYSTSWQWRLRSPYVWVTTMAELLYDIRCINRVKIVSFTYKNIFFNSYCTPFSFPPLLHFRLFGLLRSSSYITFVFFSLLKKNLLCH